jgi:cytoskeletal protein RodZ
MNLSNKVGIIVILFIVVLIFIYYKSKAPTSAPTTPAPTSAPTTPAPTSAPTTPAPTRAPTTPAPTRAPTTLAPTSAPTTPAPTRAPTTPAPTSAPTTPVQNPSWYYVRSGNNTWGDYPARGKSVGTLDEAKIACSGYNSLAYYNGWANCFNTSDSTPKSFSYLSADLYKTMS